MFPTDADSFGRAVRGEVESALTAVLAALPRAIVRDAAEYVVLGGGHRWRALVVVAAGRIFREDPRPEVLPAACGVELVHAASLVLDDLPSMDDAQSRRGKPCAHLVFPRWACDMLPAYLVNLAYAVTLRNDRVEAERRIVSALALAHAGLSMCRGQESDITQAARGSADIEACYLHKSAALYAAAAEVGARLAGADPASAERLHACGLDLGMSYQFQDDIADVEAKETDIGKTVRRDVGKRTAVSLFGLEETRRRAGRFLESALARIEGLGPEADSLRSLIRQASWASP